MCPFRKWDVWDVLVCAEWWDSRQKRLGPSHRLGISLVQVRILTLPALLVLISCFFLRFSAYLLLLILASRTELWLWLQMCILENWSPRATKRSFWHILITTCHWAESTACSWFLPRQVLISFGSSGYIFPYLNYVIIFSCSNEKCLDFILTSHFPVAVSKENFWILSLIILLLKWEKQLLKINLLIVR